MRVWSLGVWSVAGIAVVANCGMNRPETSDNRAEPSLTDGTLTPSSSDARASLESLRERFRVTPIATAHQPVRAPAPVPVIGAGVATSFEATGDAHVHAVVSADEKRIVRRAASVDLPMHARGMVRLEDDTSHVSLGFALRDAIDSPIAVVDGIALYRGAFGGADVVHRVHAEGTEDFVVFDERPALEEIVYDVDVSGVAGLRLVSNTLEILDASGTPVLRVAPPYIVDATGSKREAALAVDGCAYDMDTRGPWGRAVTRPGAASCGVRVSWTGEKVVYPAMVDPAWVATGSMATARAFHTATLLVSGQVLVAGSGTSATSSAELFNPAGAGTFAATGSMASARYFHTATLLPSGKVLIVGGQSGAGPYASAELFDPASGSFGPTGMMPSAHSAHSATLLTSGKVLIAGGIDATFSDTAVATLFDPTGAGTFAPTGSMTKARDSQTGTLLASGKVLIAGGNNGLATAELFDGIGTFAATGLMTTARAHHTATLLASGAVLIAGGSGVSGLLASAELFDGNSAFAATGSMTTARSLAAAAVDATGKVLITGGEPTNNSPVSSVDLFNGTSTFAATAAMTTARIWHTATPLLTGAILVTGGQNAGVANLSSAEIFYDQPAGDACTTNAQCASNVCNESCCSGLCSGVCMTCAGGGACVAVKNADDPNTCTGASTCDETGVCKLKTGQASLDSTTCASGFASDGFCCDTACSGSCDVCAKSLGASADGTCTPIAAGTPGMPACATGVFCDGTNAICPVSCAANTDCATSFCADGVCCDTACGSACDVCAKSLGASADGTCTPTPAGKAATPACADGSLCDGTSVTCPPACTSNADCASNFCADGVCCNTVCSGQCEACDTPNHSGTCMPVTGAPHGMRAACAAPGGAKCGGTCDGTNAAACSYPSSTVCATSCTSGQETDSTCDGTGKCVLGMEHACDLNIVTCENATSCKKTCAATTDCAAGNVCNSGKCEPATTGVCSGSIITSPDGTMKTDCSPFNCKGGGTCLSSCSSVDDCATPNVCNSAMQCVAPEAAPDSGASGGCSIGTIPNEVPWRAPTWIWTLGLGVVVLRRRRAARG